MGPASAEDSRELVALCNEANRRQTCSVARGEGWPHFRDGFGDPDEDEEEGVYGGDGCVLTARDEGGRIAGYAVLSRANDVAAVAEIAGKPGPGQAEVFGSLLSALAAKAVERRCGEIKFFLPRHQAFAVFARRYGCRVESEYPRNAHDLPPSTLPLTGSDPQHASALISGLCCQGKIASGAGGR